MSVTTAPAPSVTARSASARPTQKVSVAAATGAATAILVWALEKVFGFPVPPEIAAALTTLLTFVAGYFTPPLPGEVVES